MSPNLCLLKSLEENFSNKASQLGKILSSLRQAERALNAEDSDLLLSKLNEIDNLQSQIDAIDTATNALYSQLDEESFRILTFTREGQTVPIWGQNLYQLYLQQRTTLNEIASLHQKLVTDISARSEQLKNKLRGIKKQKELNANFNLQSTLDAGSILNFKEGE